jgi:hypothetical protein
MRKVKVDTKLKNRIEKGYKAIAESNGQDTTKYEKQLLRLEKRLVESALGITLTNEEVEDLRVIVNVKAVFPGSRVVGVSEKRPSQKNYNYETKLFHLQNPEKEGGEINMPLIAKVPERRLCPMGAHKAKVEKIEPKHHQEWGERVLFIFLLVGKAYDDRMPIRQFTEAGNTLTRKSKLRKFVEGILGRKLTNEEVQGFDLETLIGHECQIVVKHEEGVDGNMYSRIETVIPV